MQDFLNFLDQNLPSAIGFFIFLAVATAFAYFFQKRILNEKENNTR